MQNVMENTEMEGKSYYSNFFSPQDNVIIAESRKAIPSAFSNQCTADLWMSQLKFPKQVLSNTSMSAFPHSPPQLSFLIWAKVLQGVLKVKIP